MTALPVSSRPDDCTKCVHFKRTKGNCPECPLYKSEERKRKDLLKEKERGKYGTN